MAYRQSVEAIEGYLDEDIKMRILVLAGGYDQIALIDELKRYGHEIILEDYLENPPAKRAADKFFRISTLDEMATCRLAQKEKVELITTACTDQALLTVARVSEKLGLPSYLSAETAMNVTNKAYMKKIFDKNGILTATSVLLEDRTKWKTQLGNEMQFPVVVKPCDCNSSKGVVKIKSMEDLQRAVDAAFELSRDGKVVVEQYIEGKEISVDAWVENDQVKVLSISETVKTSNKDEAFIICKSIYPVDDIDIYYDKIQETANSIMKAFQLKNCPLLIQALIANGNVYVIECSARMGGGTKYKLIEHMSGINIMSVYVKRILGNDNQILNSIRNKRYMELIYIYTKKGIVNEMVNFDKLKKENIISDYFFYKSPGSVIEHQESSSDRVAGILLMDDCKSEVDKKRSVVKGTIDVLDHGKSIILNEWI